MTSFDLLDLVGQVDERHLEPGFPQKRVRLSTTYYYY